MPEIADWLPSVSAGQSVYSPYIRHLLPIAGYQGGSHFLATNWLPPRTGIPRVFPGVAAWVKTRWTWKRGLEMLELLSGNKPLVLRYPTPCFSVDVL